MQAPTPASGSPIDALRATLNMTSQTLLILDNFESIWYADGDHDATRELLKTIASVKNTSLVITMRATDPPAEIQWTFAEILPPLSPSSARDVFLAVHANFTDGSIESESILRELLDDLDHVPLAIHLLAQVSRGFQPRFILKRWRQRRTQMLHLESGKRQLDKLESVDVSISLSMTSLDAAHNSGAIQLLAMLCLLPDGLLCWQERLEIMEETFDNIFFDLQLLQRFALVYISGNKLGVLSPIRHFVHHHHPLDLQHAQCIFDVFWKLIGVHALVDYGPDFVSAVQIFSPEIGNIDSLIELAAQDRSSERVLDIAIDMSWFLSRTRASTDLLDRVSELVSTADPATQARFLEISGEIAYYQDRLEDATSNFRQAQNRFLELDNHIRAARCLWRQGDVLYLQSQYSEASIILLQAHEICVDLGDRAGVANCLMTLGAILRAQSNYSEAFINYTEARCQFVKTEDRRGAAQCLHGLGDVLRMQSNFPVASATLMEAREEFVQIGASLGAAQCVQGSGQILQDQERYAEASVTFEEARTEFLKIGESLGAAQCLESLGDILIFREKYLDATSALTEAMYQFNHIRNRAGEAGCRTSLGRIFIIQGNHTDAESFLTRARDLYLEIDLESNANYCSLLLQPVQ
ncbi:hypothetical protein HWV62_18096 [Athelia sp. TMB]|nr:hypothetical protein HWV62_18096 [Athelia sp. TMB]